MPLIADLNSKKKTNNKFEKKLYRPWDDISTIAYENVINDTSLTNHKQQLDTVKKNDSKQATSTSNHIILTSSNFSEEELKKLQRTLFGAQKTLLIYLLEKKEESFDNYIITECIYSEEVHKTLKLPLNTIKGMLQMLKKKKLVATFENKPGRGGFSRFKIARQIYDYFKRVD